jgi:2-polyprenyl-6-methoxyphenol hydroxylase-like FAD-dependent oxidoreductase
MSLQSTDIVVVGAGLAGTTAALLLARSGASVTLLEHDRSPGAGRTGILVGPAGTAVLSALDLGLDLRTGGTTALRYADVAGALLTAVYAEHTIAYRSSATVRSARPAGSVLLEWRDRVSMIDADLIVGADGTRSVVRAGGLFDARIPETTVTYLSGLVPSVGLDLEPERVTPLGSFGGGPVDPLTAYFYAAADAPPVVAALARRDLAEVGRLWSTADPTAGTAVARAGPALRIDTFTPVACGRTRDGRLVLIGSAARSTGAGFPLRAENALADAAHLTHVLAGTALPAPYPPPEGASR